MIFVTMQTQKLNLDRRQWMEMPVSLMCYQKHASCFRPNSVFATVARLLVTYTN